MPPEREAVARIVEVGAKQMTDREAVAECVVSMTPDACAQLVAGTPKGNPLEAARIAGVMAVKRTPDLLPFCHPIAVTGAEVLVEPDERNGTIRVQTTVRAHDRTGVEMEALTAAAVGALSLYDTGEGVRSRGAHRRSASAREARRQERLLHGGVSSRRPFVVTLM